MEWKDIKGYEGHYQVSNTGEVYSIKSGKTLKHQIPKDGYHRIGLFKGGKGKTFQVHRLVAIHFCEGYEEGLVVDHKDGNKDNNLSTNLRWVTQKINVENQMSRGTLNVSKAQQIAKIKNQKPIIVISPDGIEKEYPSTKCACEELGLTRGKVTDVLKGHRIHHKGYTFRYKLNG
ncbi:gp31.2 [Bacillus phage SPO1]|uniref:DNA endonuclease I-HmuI n=2 Tax=Bacillus phage SP01 TaxID=2884427 RepID=HMUI_BPSP1|nr:gp31.2 [Bacillus phage SPO1]P34081.1 RecName: Full=DNA endonuclease I-HmuI; AltName: Full=HNH homing endonuclease I-HmuI [Bacillus phage SPO1]AAA64536.1 intron ORF; putative [Bacillus phage SPO1]ACI91047.1 gp31.2 [Bacillus phage SPO1]1U3E_M Chain M, HNH homing endonuclease [Bacillus phage SPO1]